MYTKKLLSVFAAIMMAAAAFAQTSATDPGVVINGVKWATRNIDAPGTFADNATDYGMFYQWNRNIGWSSTDPLINSNGGTTWDTANSAGTEWAAENDPSPAGWHVPSKEELETLLDATKVADAWITQDGVNGKLFTDIATGNTLFLPAAHYRANADGVLSSNTHGYWSNTQRDVSASYYLRLRSNEISQVFGDARKTYGFSVRSVANTYTVTFNSNGGSAVEEQTIAGGDLITKPADPTKEGCEFAGWYKADDVTLWDFDTEAVTENITLSAHWTETAGVEEVRSAPAFQVFPNPAKDNVTVSFVETVRAPSLLCVFDLNGKIIKQQEVSGSSTVINTLSLASGTYIIRLVKDGAAGAGVKFVKE